MRSTVGASPPAPVLGSPGVTLPPAVLAIGAVTITVPAIGEIVPLAAITGRVLPSAPLTIIAEGFTLKVMLLPIGAADETLQTSP